MCLLDNGWQTQLSDHEERKDASVDVVFDVMNQILLIKYSLSIRRINYARKQMNESEDPSKFLRRLNTTAVNADVETCPISTTVLLKFT